MLSAASLTENSINVFASLSNSFGQVMFQKNVITGLFFLLGILINNKLMALYSVYAAVLASLTGWLLSEQITSVNAGLMGYNAILCAIALSGKSMKVFIWISIAIILSTLLNIGLAMTNIITLTAPFVLTTWIVLKFKK